MTDRIHTAILRVPKAAWTPAYDADGRPREGAWVAEVTDMLDLTAWPKSMRVVVRMERPHPGAQLRITDVDGNRCVAFVTNTAGGQLVDLELRHRRRARAEDRIRQARATGLRNLPLHGFAPKPTPVRTRACCTRVDRLNADARPDRRRPEAGDQEAPLPPLRGRGPPGPHRPTGRRPPARPMALDRAHPREVRGQARPSSRRRPRRTTSTTQGTR
ncbi:hypothetical protein GT354_16835 [Streptomyces sp. SID3343]|nr:hypothetical protein [Streptomyces sp. SID3343]